MAHSVVAPTISPAIVLFLIRRAKDGDAENFRAILESVCQEASAWGRLDELERIRAVTLDADVDVWSTRDDGSIVSLTNRLRELFLY